MLQNCRQLVSNCREEFSSQFSGVMKKENDWTRRKLMEESGSKEASESRRSWSSPQKSHTVCTSFGEHIMLHHTLRFSGLVLVTTSKPFVSRFSKVFYVSIQLSFPISFRRWKSSDWQTDTREVGESQTAECPSCERSPGAECVSGFEWPRAKQRATVDWLTVPSPRVWFMLVIACLVLFAAQPELVKIYCSDNLMLYMLQVVIFPWMF